LAYDGTDFVGWQRQKNGRTVQEVLERTFRKILQEDVHVTGAGRTDSGVHAKGQVAHLAIRSSMPIPVLQQALNAILPPDILVRSIRVVPAGFHARYSVKSKWYRYQIWNSPLRPLFERPWVFHFPKRLNVARMKRAAKLLQGRHDFRPFRSTGSVNGSTSRSLKSLTLQKKGPLIWIDAKADGFLYHMVRRIVGLLLEVGKGSVPLQEIPSLLKGKSALVPPTAPARGLCLMEVHYA